MLKTNYKYIKFELSNTKKGDQMRYAVVAILFLALAGFGGKGPSYGVSGAAEPPAASLMLQ